MINPTDENTTTKPIATAAETPAARPRRRSVDDSTWSPATNAPRYAGSSENPQGLNVATIPAVNARASVELVMSVTSCDAIYDIVS